MLEADGLQDSGIHKAVGAMQRNGRCVIGIADQRQHLTKPAHVRGFDQLAQ